MVLSEFAHYSHPSSMWQSVLAAIGRRETQWHWRYIHITYTTGETFNCLKNRIIIVFPKKKRHLVSVKG